MSHIRGLATRVSPQDLHAIEALATELDVPVSALVRGWVLAGLNARKAQSMTTALDGSLPMCNGSSISSPDLLEGQGDGHPGEQPLFQWGAAPVEGRQAAVGMVSLR